VKIGLFFWITRRPRALRNEKRIVKYTRHAPTTYLPVPIPRPPALAGTGGMDVSRVTWFEHSLNKTYGYFPGFGFILISIGSR
jgi:hypothetical protein